MSDRIKSFEDLKTYAGSVSVDKPDRTVIAVGAATCGIAAGARETIDALNASLRANHVKNVDVVETGCLGFCFAEPIVEVREPGSDPVRYAGVDAKLAESIVELHIVGGAIVRDHVLGKEVPR